jgi:hypothetical protein
MICAGNLRARVARPAYEFSERAARERGAELDSEIEHQPVRDTTVGHPKPPGARGAVMADTLGPAVPNTSKEH